VVEHGINSTDYTLQICAAFCQSWYSACGNATLGGRPLRDIFTPVEFCTLHGPPGLSVEVISSSVGRCLDTAREEPTSAAKSCSQDIRKIVKEGQRISFTIRAADGWGNYKRTGGDHFVVRIKGDGYNSRANVTDMHNGTYLVSYIAPPAGLYVVESTLGGCNTCGFPFVLIVRDGRSVS
jgi:hypothetical protein